MRTRFIFFLFAFCATAALTTQAQESMSLRDVLQQVLERNPKLRSADARISVARTKVRQAAAWDDPQFAFEFYQVPASSLNPLMDNMENDYSLQQMIPFPGKKGLAADMAAWTARMQEYSTDAVRRQLIADAASAFAMLYAAQRRIAVIRQSKQTLHQIIETMTSRYAAGGSSQAELLLLNVEDEKLGLDETRAQQEGLSAEAMINALRALPAGTPIGDVTRPPMVPPPDSADVLLATALRARPELAGMNAEIEMYKSERDMQRRERLPDFMARGMYKQMLMDGPDYWALMVGVNIPIAPWASGKYSARIEEAEANIMASENSYRDMEAMTAFEVRDAWLKCRSLWTQLDRYRTVILPTTDEAYRAALAQFQTNTAAFRTVLEALRMREMYAMDEAMLEGEYLAARARLHRATGTDDALVTEHTDQ
jgi:outer membrane protein, heavy metal efflux system